MTGYPHTSTLYKATVALYDGLHAQAWTELFTDREVAQAWSEWKTDLCEQRRPDAIKGLGYAFEVTTYPIDRVRMIDIEEFTEDTRELVDEIMGGGSA